MIRICNLHSTPGACAAMFAALISAAAAMADAPKIDEKIEIKNFDNYYNDIHFFITDGKALKFDSTLPVGRPELRNGGREIYMDGFESTPSENTSMKFNAQFEPDGSDRFGYKLVSWNGWWTRDGKKQETFAQSDIKSKRADLGGGSYEAVCELGNLQSWDVTVTLGAAVVDDRFNLFDDPMPTFTPLGTITLGQSQTWSPAGVRFGAGQAVVFNCVGTTFEGQSSVTWVESDLVPEPASVLALAVAIPLFASRRRQPR